MKKKLFHANKSYKTKQNSLQKIINKKRLETREVKNEYLILYFFLKYSR